MGQINHADRSRRCAEEDVLPTKMCLQRKVYVELGPICQPYA